MKTLTQDKIKELEKNKDTVQKRLNEETDHFFIYGMVRQIEDIDRQIEVLKKQENHV